MMRIGKFVAARPRVVWEFPNKEPQTAIDIYVDTNWVGCRRTRTKEIDEWRMCDARQALHKSMVEDSVDHSKILWRD